MVKIKVDIENREKLKRLHTATHIINFCAKKVLGNHVWQNGSNLKAEIGTLLTPPPPRPQAHGAKAPGRSHRTSRKTARPRRAKLCRCTWQRYCRLSKAQRNSILLQAASRYPPSQRSGRARRIWVR